MSARAHADTRAVLRGLLACAIVIATSIGSQRATAQIAGAEYAARRAALAERVKEGVVVGFGARNPVSDFGPFHQLPAFHYLTSFDEPDAAFLMIVHDGRGESTLFLSAVEPRAAFYYGRRPDSAAVVREHGLKARAFEALTATLDSLSAAGLTVYTIGDHEDADFARRDSLTRGAQFFRALAARLPTLSVKGADELVSMLRAKKSPAELAMLKRAAEISTEGHRAAMQLSEPAHEYEIRAALEYAFTRLGGTRPSYGSIVGGGVHGTQLHYMRDNGDVKPGDLVVMDAATEYEGYAADITRTLPVSGKFSADQRLIYQLVLDAQKAAERNSKPGMPQAAASDSAFDIRAQGLVALGLAEGLDASFDPPWKVDCARTPRACRQTNFWMIHGISHGLGLEVHDPAQFYFGDRTFKEGDAFTIEPGIYVSSTMLEALPDTPRNRAFIAKVMPAVKRFQNSGVRIEDDYIITAKGLERTSLAPREISEVEALMRTRPPRVIP